MIIQRRLGAFYLRVKVAFGLLIIFSVMDAKIRKARWRSSFLGGVGLDFVQSESLADIVAVVLRLPLIDANFSAVADENLVSFREFAK